MIGYLVIIVLSVTFCFTDLSTSLSPEGRIIGGKNAKIEDFPYQLSLRSNGSHFCGGSIIGPYTAVTAAHCVKVFDDVTDPSIISFRAGSANRTSGGTIHNALNITVHENYSSVTVDNDIAVIFVKEPFPIGSKTVDVVKLADTEVVAGTKATVSGWGLLVPGNYTLPVILQEVDVPIVSRTVCEKAYKGAIFKSMICAGYDQGGKGSCQEDSGGPLVVNKTLVGIVSWGKGCADAGYPGVYSNIAELRAWLKKKTGI